MRSLNYLCLILCFLLVGCSKNSSQAKKWSLIPPTKTTAPKVNAKTKQPSNLITAVKINDQRFTLADLQTGLVEAAGGQILSEKILSLQLRKELGQTLITENQIQNERDRFTQSLHVDPHLAEKLLKQLRQRQGLGDFRFNDFLFRQAALRHLVQPEVSVSQAAIVQAYDLKFGPTSVVQIITTDATSKAVAILNRARQGEDFGQLVQLFSQDTASKPVNGILDPISPADASYPTAVHKAIARLTPGRISDVVALDNGFVILKMIRKNNGKTVTLADVKESLALKVRSDVEQMLMRQLAIGLMDEAKVTVMDRNLNQSWQANKRNLSVEIK